MKVLICDQVHPIASEILRKEGFEVDEVGTLSEDELAKIIADYDAAITRGSTKWTRKVFENAKRLKVLVRAGVGLDNIDLEAAREFGVKVFNTPRALVQSVAELVIGLMINALRRIHEADRKMKEGVRAKKELVGYTLANRTVGIIGMGRIGTRVAELVTAFGSRVIGNDVDKERVIALGYEYRDIDDLLKEADIVTIHVPLTPKTRGLINAERIAKMKDGAILINTSRGAVVDEKALLEALEKGKIAYAALDVFSKEPPFDDPILEKLVKHPRVIATPHIGAQTVDAQKHAAEEAARIIVNELKKRFLKFVLISSSNNSIILTRYLLGPRIPSS